VIKISVADPASGALIREGEKIQIRDPDLGSRINVSDHISKSSETIFGLKIL
jgi:hypothetical protein